jgi:VanZ family protein
VTHFPKLRLEGVPGDDKTAHVLAYALLAFLIWQFRAARARPIRAGFVLKAWGLVAAYATVDELTQPLVGRSADIYDWLADLAGATAALAILEWRRRARTCNDRDVRALG